MPVLVTDCCGAGNAEAAGHAIGYGVPEPANPKHTNAARAAGCAAVLPPADAARPAMFVAGDDADAKATTLDPVADLGFDVFDSGALAVSRLLEPYAMLWIHQVVNRGAPSTAAFALLRKG